MIATVVSQAQLAHARVQAARLRELDPTASLTVLVIDDPGVRAPEDGIEWLRLRDVFAQLSPRLFGYLPDELRHHARAALVNHGLAKGEHVVLVEPELDLHAPLDDMRDLAAEHGLVLVPRLLAPVPDDGARPSDAEVAQDGIYNSGLMAVGAGEAGRAFAHWWRDRQAYAGDQLASLLDLAPSLFPGTVVVRDTGHGVAYWNLPARPLEAPALRSFYFVGFDPQRPYWLNDANTRVSVTENPALTALCEDYASRLLEAGFEADVPWGYSRLANGLAVDDALRALLVNADEDGLVLEDPFSPEGTRQLMAWATDEAPVGGASGVTRYLLEVYRSRGDLPHSFPNLDSDDGERFVEWAREHGSAEMELPAALLPGGPITPAKSADGALGVNVAGYLSGGLGLGEAARSYVRALQAADVVVRTESVDPPLPPSQRTFGVQGARKRLSFNELDPPNEFPINLVCVNAPEFAGFTKRIGPEFFANRKTIGVWAWETSFVPPEWDDDYGQLDEIWTYTTYVANVLAQRAPVPVVAVPLPVSTPTAIAPELDIELNDGFTFLFAFDFFSTIQRKNPLGLIEAFKRAFAPGEGPQLVLKSFNGDYKPEHLERLRHAIRERDDIRLVDQFVSVEQRNALMARADCYVSLHRSEGFGLTLAEAMALGKPVIATAYSGNLDFMDPSCSYLVDYELTRVGPGVEIYPAEGIWAEPDLEHAAALMRHVVEDPADAAEKAERGRARIAEQLSPEACGAIARQRLERLGVPLRAEPTVTQMPAPPALVDLRRQAAFDPMSTARGKHPRDLSRRAALEAMRPFTHHQTEFDRYVVESFNDLLAYLQLRFEYGDEHVDQHILSLTRRARRADWRARRLEDRVARLESLLKDAHDLLDANGVATLERVVEGARARPASTHPLLTEASGEGLAFGEFNRADADDGYAGFEDIFRGSEEVIRERLGVYLPILSEHTPVLDIGCGRGELLELLRDAGLQARGVDLDEGMVERCRAKGLDAEHADAIAALEAVPEASLGAIVAIQVVEHLPYEVLLRFLELCRTRLKPDGVLIAETVNPHSPPALKAFWTDPTHQHPVLPEVLLALCRLGGFGSGKVMLPGVDAPFGRAIYDARDYAVVASPS